MMTTRHHSFWHWRYRSEAEVRIYLLVLLARRHSIGPAANDEQESTVR